MANHEHEDILKKGVEVWNRWRQDHSEIEPDLSGMSSVVVTPRGPDAVSIRGINLRDFDFRSSDLSNASLSWAQLQSADLSESNLEGASSYGADLTEAMLDEACLCGANLKRASLTGARLRKADLSNADLSESDLTKADLFQATLNHTNLRNAALCEAELVDVRCYLADFREAELPGANFFLAELLQCDFSKAKMHGAKFTKANCIRSSFAHAEAHDANFEDANLTAAMFLCADLTGARLHGASLEGALMIRTDLSGAKLWATRSYGASVWEVITDEKTMQRSLPIGSLNESDEPELRVDDLGVAQFLHMLRDHKRLGKVINTLTSRLVLLLGPFKEGGLEQLRTVADRLKSPELGIQGYWPVIFDFDRPEDRDLEEAARLLVGLSRFVIADVGGPSVGHELAATVKNFRVPVAPIIQQHKTPYMVFSSFKRERHVLSLVKYKDTVDLVDKLGEIVRLAEKERARLRAEL